MLSNSGDMSNFICTPMLKNHVNDCHGNHEFIDNENKFLLCISGVPMNDLAPIKIVLGCKVGQISSRGIG